jgi:hypothetical protein
MPFPESPMLDNVTGDDADFHPAPVKTAFRRTPAPFAPAARPRT